MDSFIKDTVYSCRVFRPPMSPEIFSCFKTSPLSPRSCHHAYFQRKLRQHITPLSCHINHSSIIRTSGWELRQDRKLYLFSATWQTAPLRRLCITHKKTKNLFTSLILYIYHPRFLNKKDSSNSITLRNILNVDVIGWRSWFLSEKRHFANQQRSDDTIIIFEVTNSGMFEKCIQCELPKAVWNLKTFIKLEPSESKVTVFCLVTGCVSGRWERRYIYLS